MRVAALQGVHSPGIFGLCAVEEAGSAAAAAALQIGHFQRHQIFVLGVGNFGLPAKGEIAHSHAVGAVGVSRNRQTARFGDNLIGVQDISAGSGLGAAQVQLLGRDVQIQEYVLQMAHARLWRKDA